MLRKFTITNFHSIRDTLEIDFLLHHNAKNNDKIWLFHSTADDSIITSIISLFGANWSGKSNILRAFWFLKYFVVSQEAMDTKELVPLTPFSFTNNINSKFSLEFEIKKKIYEYVLEVNPDEVVEERLTILGVKEVKLFTRIKNVIKENSTWILLPPTLNPKVSTVAILSFLNAENTKIKPIIDYFRSIYTNTSSIWFRSLSSDWIPELNLSPSLIDILKENITLREEVMKFIHSMDTGLYDLEIQKSPPGKDGEEGFRIDGIHYYEWKKHNLPWHMESEGTRSMINLFPRLLLVLKRGGVAIIDEVDSNLHPLIVHKLVSLFLDKEVNLHNAQIIFSSHCPSLIDILDKKQIKLISKNIDGVTRIENFSIRPEIKNKADYYMHALSGWVPNIIKDYEI